MIGIFIEYDDARDYLTLPKTKKALREKLNTLQAEADVLQEKVYELEEQLEEAYRLELEELAEKLDGKISFLNDEIREREDAIKEGDTLLEIIGELNYSRARLRANGRKIFTREEIEILAAANVCDSQVNASLEESRLGDWIPTLLAKGGVILEDDGMHYVNEAFWVHR